MNALEMALEALTNPSTIAVIHAIYLLREELAKPEQEPVKKALRLKPHECICGYSVGHPLIPKCICKPEYTAQPEQEELIQFKNGKWSYIKKPWVGLTDDEIQDILDCGRSGLVDIKKAEQILKEKNGG